MLSAFSLYFRFLILLVALTVVIAVNFTVWGLRRYPKDAKQHVPVARADRGHVAIERYGCGACHVIPGVRDAVGRVGPRLNGLEEQIYIAGVLTNTPQNLATWIRTPRGIDPLTAMPNLGVSQQEARDIAAYLYTLR